MDNGETVGGLRPENVRMTILSSDGGGVVHLRRVNGWRYGRINAERPLFAEAIRELRSLGYRDAAKVVLAIATGQPSVMRGAEHIEVTPEMVDAGAWAAFGLDPIWDGSAVVMPEIFWAMIQAAPRHVLEAILRARSHG